MVTGPQPDRERESSTKAACLGAALGKVGLPRDAAAISISVTLVISTPNDGSGTQNSLGPLCTGMLLVKSEGQNSVLIILDDYGVLNANYCNCVILL